MSINAGYFRHPTIAGDTIAFVSEDDVWQVAADGGPASRLTAGLSEVSRPVLSPDGGHLAFTSREEHHAEVWCMPGSGGPAHRVTWHGAQAIPRLFLPDGRILFVSDAGQPFASQLYAYAVAPAGGQPERLPYGPVREVAYGPDGGVVLGRNTADPARWKRYRGGTAGRLWIDPRGSGQFKPLVDLPGNLASPMWIGRRVLFISDHEGVGNLYSVRPDGRDLRRHTDHDRYYARFAVTDGRRVVYQHAAEIWLFDPDADEANRVEVDFRSPRAQRGRRFVPADRFMSNYAVHPEGRAVAVETRGKAFTMPLWEEAVRQRGRPDGVRYRMAQWTHDGETVVAISDEDGEDAIEVHTADGTARRLAGLDLGRVIILTPSPTAAQVAITNHRRELLLVDLDSGGLTRLDRSEYGHLSSPTWSPDGRWLAYSSATSVQTISIKLCELASGRTTLVTRPEFRDFTPAFDPSGDYLYFLSYRRFDPVYDSLFFDLGFPKAVLPYLVTLRAELPSPFLARPARVRRSQGRWRRDDGRPRCGSTSTASTAGWCRSRCPRIVTATSPAFPARCCSTAGPSRAAWDATGRRLQPDPAGAIEVYDLAEHKHDTLISGASSFTVSRDGCTLVYAAGSRLRAVKAGEKPPEGSEHEPPGRKSGWIDLERIRVSVDPAAEWRQMYRRGVAAAARPLLGRGHVGRRLERGA